MIVGLLLSHFGNLCLTVNSIAIVMPTPYVAIYINSQEVKWFVQVSIHDVVWGLFDTDRHEQFYTTASYFT